MHKFKVFDVDIIPDLERTIKYIRDPHRGDFLELIVFGKEVSVLIKFANVKGSGSIKDPRRFITHRTIKAPEGENTFIFIAPELQSISVEDQIRMEYEILRMLVYIYRYIGNPSYHWTTSYSNTNRYARRAIAFRYPGYDIDHMDSILNDIR